MLREGPVRIWSARADDAGVGTRAAIYARVSTVAGQSPQMQLDVLREYAGRRGLEIAAEFVDHGVSGARDHRPELDRIMAGARQRAFEVVLVYRFDRFARGVRHLVTALDEFQALDIEFVSFSESLDTSTPMGRAMFAIVAASPRWSATSSSRGRSRGSAAPVRAARTSAVRGARSTSRAS